MSSASVSGDLIIIECRRRFSLCMFHQASGPAVFGASSDGNIKRLFKISLVLLPLFSFHNLVLLFPEPFAEKKFPENIWQLNFHDFLETLKGN